MAAKLPMPSILKKVRMARVLQAPRIGMRNWAHMIRIQISRLIVANMLPKRQ